MKSLMIKDLSLAEELDHKAMAAVHGGIIYHVMTWDDWVKTLPAMPSPPRMPGYIAPPIYKDFRPDDNPPSRL